MKLTIFSTSAARWLSSAILVGAVSTSAAAQTFFGPTPYLSTADSPFPLGSPAFVLEDFEDHLLNVPGVTAVGGFVTSTHFSGNIDSVDGDDGIVGNGACANCDSYFNAGHVEFDFDASVLGGYPRKVGIVWTDGGSGCTATFEAFDANLVSLGTKAAPGIGDGSNAGTTAEDRFFGIEFPGGVRKITVTNSSGGIEVDHLQYELPCLASTASVYCTAKVNSLGCSPHIGLIGCPSVSIPSPCTITGSKFLNNKNGLLFYGHQQNGAPFQGGFLCVKLPVVRVGLQSSGGNSTGSSCTGSYFFDLNAWIQGGFDSSLVVGAPVYLQWWGRDPQDAFTTSLSDALSLTVGA